MRVGGGELVQQFIRSLPPGQRPQRVPSRANAAPPPGRSNFPFTSQPRNMHVTSEVRSLKEQMAEMRQMLQMTYEMQMDTQRAIRQEVSAVFSAFMQQMSQGLHLTIFQQLKKYSFGKDIIFGRLVYLCDAHGIR